MTDDAKPLREAITKALNDGDLEAAQVMIDRETEDMFPEDDPLDFEITVVEPDMFDPSIILEEWEDGQ